MAPVGLGRVRRRTRPGAGHQPVRPHRVADQGRVCEGQHPRDRADAGRLSLARDGLRLAALRWRPGRPVAAACRAAAPRPRRSDAGRCARWNVVDRHQARPRHLEWPPTDHLSAVRRFLHRGHSPGSRRHHLGGGEEGARGRTGLHDPGRHGRVPGCGRNLRHMDWRPLRGQSSRTVAGLRQGDVALEAWAAEAVFDPRRCHGLILALGRGRDRRDARGRLPQDPAARARQTRDLATSHHGARSRYRQPRARS